MHHGEFRDPLLVQIYDAAFPWSREDDFFMTIVNESSERRVLDLGCGTGRLALAIAAAGHSVTAVDPARASLATARAKPGSDRVTWSEGSSAALPPTSFDLAMMTSHVAQFFVDDEDWEGALADLHRSIVPGGVLVFDSRDPRARAWLRWNPTDSLREVALPGGGTVTMWTTVTGVEDARVSFAIDYRFSTGETRASTATLRFRSEEEIRSTLAAAGFTVRQIYGGWQGEPVGEGDGELLIVGRAS